VQILPLAVSFVVFPYLTEWAGQGARDKMADALVSMTRALAFLFVPAGVALVLLAKPVVELLYLRGAFRAEDVGPTAIALVCFAPGLLFYAVEGSINKWFFALKDTVTPNVVGILAVFVHIAIALVGAYVLHGEVAVLALAYSVSKSLKVLALYLLVKPRIGEIRSAPVLAYAAKLAVACAVMGGALLGAELALAPVLKNAKLVLLGSVCAGTVAFLIAAAVVRIEEFYLVTDHLLGKLRKRLKR
jgi:putative peptidoglycan lipid II flippase